jgi:hypothetical protein
VSVEGTKIREYELKHDQEFQISKTRLRLLTSRIVEASTVHAAPNPTRALARRWRTDRQGHQVLRTARPAIMSGDRDKYHHVRFSQLLVFPSFMVDGSFSSMIWALPKEEENSSRHDR